MRFNNVVNSYMDVVSQGFQANFMSFTLHVLNKTSCYFIIGFKMIVWEAMICFPNLKIRIALRSFQKRKLFLDTTLKV